MIGSGGPSHRLPRAGRLDGKVFGNTLELMWDKPADQWPRTPDGHQAAGRLGRQFVEVRAGWREATGRGTLGHRASCP